MISFRQADLLEKTMKTRLHDVFFYIWFSTDVKDNLVRDYNGRWSAYLEAYFPDKITKWDDENVELNIEQKIERALGQPISQRIFSKPDEDISQFYEQLRNKFEPKLKQISEGFEFDSLVSHGMAFRLKMTAL